MSYSTGNPFKTPDTAASCTSNLRCPHCSALLQQMGYLEGPMLPGQREWVGENLYRCQSCPPGKNRFIMMGSGLMQQTARINGGSGVRGATGGVEVAGSETEAEVAL